MNWLGFILALMLKYCSSAELLRLACFTPTPMRFFAGMLLCFSPVCRYAITYPIAIINAKRKAGIPARVYEAETQPRQGFPDCEEVESSGVGGD